MKRMREDDVELLLPSFRAAYKLVLQDMKDIGFDPCPFDTARTTAEALKNSQRGTGILRSVHILLAAADTICHKHWWNCAKAGCRFYPTLRDRYEARGLVAGARFRKVDWPHGQGVLVSEQDELWALAPEHRDAFVAASIARRLTPRS